MAKVLKGPQNTFQKTWGNSTSMSFTGFRYPRGKEHLQEQSLLLWGEVCSNLSAVKQVQAIFLTPQL